MQFLPVPSVRGGEIFSRNLWGTSRILFFLLLILVFPIVFLLIFLIFPSPPPELRWHSGAIFAHPASRTNHQVSGLFSPSSPLPPPDKHVIEFTIFPSRRKGPTFNGLWVLPIAKIDTCSGNDRSSGPPRSSRSVVYEIPMLSYPGNCGSSPLQPRKLFIRIRLLVWINHGKHGAQPSGKSCLVPPGQVLKIRSRLRNYRSPLSWWSWSFRSIKNVQR